MAQDQPQEQSQEKPIELLPEATEGEAKKVLTTAL
jgi:hypothetical protein